jgi:hypothetical protein
LLYVAEENSDNSKSLGGERSVPAAVGLSLYVVSLIALTVTFFAAVEWTWRILSN